MTDTVKSTKIQGNGLLQGKGEQPLPPPKKKIPKENITFILFLKFSYDLENTNNHFSMKQELC